jgi:hypothetical protein
VRGVRLEQRAAGRVLDRPGRRAVKARHGAPLAPWAAQAERGSL